MSEWWTYRPSDFLMFSPRTYYRMFELYNRALWPAQLLALGAGIVLILCLARRPERRGRVAAAILGGAWLWVGVAFHLACYAAIHTGAKYFAAAAIVESGLLCWWGLRGSAAGGRRRGLGRQVGLALIAAAVALLPLAGALLGRDWRAMEIFGLAPDPTALATLGALLLRPVHRGWLCWVVPVLWCAWSGTTLWTLGAGDAWILPLGAAVALAAALLDPAQRDKDARNGEREIDRQRADALRRE